MTIICFTFEQVICGFPLVGAPSDSLTVSTNSFPDAIKYFVQQLLNVFVMKFLWVYGKWTSTKLKILVQSRVHSQASVAPPTFFAITLFNFLTFPSHSSPVKVFVVVVFLWYQHARTPELPLSHALINTTKGNATQASFIFAARSPNLRGKLEYHRGHQPYPQVCHSQVCAVRQ